MRIHGGRNNEGLGEYLGFHRTLGEGKGLGTTCAKAKRRGTASGSSPAIPESKGAVDANEAKSPRRWSALRSVRVRIPITRREADDSVEAQKPGVHGTNGVPAREAVGTAVVRGGVGESLVAAAAPVPSANLRQRYDLMTCG